MTQSKGERESPQTVTSRAIRAQSGRRVNGDAFRAFDMLRRCDARGHAGTTRRFKAIGLLSTLRKLNSRISSSNHVGTPLLPSHVLDFSSRLQPLSGVAALKRVSDPLLFSTRLRRVLSITKRQYYLFVLLCKQITKKPRVS